MIWFDVDGARQYLAQHEGSNLPSRKTIYRMVANGMRVARGENKPDRERGGTAMRFTPEWIDEYLLSRRHHQRTR